MLLLTLAAALAASPAAPPPAPPSDTTRYLVISNGTVAGGQRAWRTPDGVLHYTFEYNDRGRGSSLHTRMRVNEAGIPVWMETTGHDYFKKPVQETFEMRGGRATWRNSAEQGDRAVQGTPWYAAMQDASDSGLLIRALLAAPDRTLPLLPEGRIRLDSVGEMDVTAGGRTQRVAQYTVTGFGFEPSRLWLDRDRGFFAAGSEWFALVREGWQEALPVLFRVQDQAQEAWAAELSRRLSHRQTAPVVIRNANLFDAETGASRPGTTVVISGNRIQAVGPDAATAAPAGATVIDAAGKALLPGLWDMHVHAGLSDGPLHLAAGVTSVRDLGNDSVATPRLARAWNAGTGLGPRIVLAGFIDGPGPFASPVGSRADTEAEARAAVAWYADHGYEHIKMYSSLKPELVTVIADEAHRRGMRVSGHVPEGMRAQDVVRAGFDELQHVNMLVLNFLPDSLDTRTPQRFVGPAQQAADLDLSSAAVRGFVALLKERGTVVDPTLSAFEGMLVDREGTISPSFAAVAERMPPNVRRGFLTGGLPVPEGMDQRYRDSFRRMLDFVKLLHDAGVPLVPGTDNMAGFALHRELELYVEAGIPAPEVLRIATLGAATVARRQDRLGTIAPGKLADVILVDGDPARRISDIRRVELVIKDGVIYRPDELYEAFGVLPMK